MKKLYSDEPVTSVTDAVSVEEIKTMPDELTLLNQAFETIQEVFNVYPKVHTLTESMEAADYALVDHQNYQFYNDYMKTICRNLGSDTAVPQVSKIAAESLEPVFLNRSFALEGFLGDLWAKIQQVFASLISKLKDFYKKYMTRTGVITNRLNNVKKVLSGLGEVKFKDTNADASSKLKKYFGTNATVNFKVVLDTITNTFALNDNMVKIIDEAGAFTKIKIVDPDELRKFKENISKLAANKEKSDKLNQSKEDVENNASGLQKAIPFSETNKQLKNISKDIQDTEKDSQQAKDENAGIQSQVDEFTKNGVDEGEDKAVADATKALNTVLYNITTQMKGKVLIDGKIVQPVEKPAEDESGIKLFELEDQPSEDEVTVLITGKENLIKGIDECLAFIDSMNKINEKSTKVLEDFEDSIDKVSKSIVTVDGDKDSLKDYNTYITKNVKPRLLTFKSAFVALSKITTNFNSLYLDACDGMVEYSVACMKHYST